MNKSGDEFLRPGAAVARRGRDGRGAETRRRLIDAAITVVADRGWDRATTREIATRAGANQALIGYHFGSRGGLLHAAAESALREGFTAPVDALVAVPSFVDGLEGVLAELAAMDESQPLVRFAMEVLSRSPRDPALRATMAGLLDELRGRLRDGIAAAQARGEIPTSVDASGVAALLAGVFDGIGLHLLIDPTLDIRPIAAASRRLLTDT